MIVGSGGTILEENETGWDLFRLRTPADLIGFGGLAALAAEPADASLARAPSSVTLLEGGLLLSRWVFSQDVEVYP